MFTDQYIVLSSRNTVVPTLDNLGTRGGVGGFAAGPEDMQLDEVTLTVSERNDLRRDPRTRAIAPPMPLSLIEPFAADAADDTGSADATWGVEAVGAPTSPFDGGDVTVAVLDTGIDPHHAAFAGVELVRRNFTTESDDDLNGHGTHCAGTIFGQDVDGTRIGVARNIDRALIAKVLGQGGGTSATIAQAIQWSVNEGANVISMSLGIDFPGFVELLVEQYGLDINPATSIALEAYRANVNLFTELARFVRAQDNFGTGTVIVAASGNESNRPDYEIAVAPPAAGTGVIAVGALGQQGAEHTVAAFSNNQVDISAPGVAVVSATPGGGLAALSGTSMATPHVAGVAALWAQRQLELTGGIDGSRLMARVVASGEISTLAAGTEAEDVGTGMVRAPQH